MVKRGKSALFYTAEELKAIKEQWLKDKQRIDDEYKGQYHWDKDKEYEKYFQNKNLRMLFHHAAYLYRGYNEGDTYLYPKEKGLVAEVYKKVLRDGYYNESKIEEKKIRARFGKAISRQYYRKYGKKYRY